MLSRRAVLTLIFLALGAGYILNEIIDIMVPGNNESPAPAETGEVIADNFKSLAPNLMVKSVNESIKYYSEVLGFETVMTMPEEGELDWAMMGRGEVILMFQRKENLISEYPRFEGMEPGGTLVLYVNVENIEALYKELKGTANITTELHEKFYGAVEFVVEDPDGYVITFAQQPEED